MNEIANESELLEQLEMDGCGSVTAKGLASVLEVCTKLTLLSARDCAYVNETDVRKQLESKHRIHVLRIG